MPSLLSVAIRHPIKADGLSSSDSTRSIPPKSESRYLTCVTLGHVAWLPLAVVVNAYGYEPYWKFPVADSEIVLFMLTEWLVMQPHDSGESRRVTSVDRDPNVDDVAQPLSGRDGSGGRDAVCCNGYTGFGGDRRGSTTTAVTLTAFKPFFLLTLLPSPSLVVGYVADVVDLGKNGGSLGRRR